MGERFAPIPYSALAIAGTDGRLAVLDLYTRGHTCGWRAFHASSRELAATWGVDRRRVARILDDLSAAGMVEMAGGDVMFTSRSIRVVCPHEESAPETVQTDSLLSLMRAPDAAPVRAPDHAPTRAGEDSRAQTEPKRTEENRTEKRQTSTTDWKAWPSTLEEHAIAARYAVLMKELELPNIPTKPEVNSIRRLLNDGTPVKDILDVLDWSCKSDHFTAASNRKGGYLRSETPWRPSKFESYLGFARLPQPKAAGQYDASKAPPPPMERHDDDDLPF